VKTAISVPMAAGFKRIFVYLLAEALFGTRMPVTFPLISVLASWRDFGHISRLQHSEPPQAGTTASSLKRPNFGLAPNHLVQVVFEF
jgi:hypothetical protein